MGSLNSELIIFRKWETKKSLCLIHVATWSIAYQYTGLTHANRACTQTIDFLFVDRRAHIIGNKNSRGFYCVEAQGVWGGGGERRKQARAVEEKTSVNRRTQT